MTTVDPIEDRKRRKQRMTIKWEILKALADSREGMNSRQIRDFVDYPVMSTISVYLSNYQAEGLVRQDGRAECPHCFAEKVCYRITEDGRRYVAEKAVEI